MTLPRLNVIGCTNKLRDSKITAEMFRDAIDKRWRLDNVREIMESVGAYSRNPCLTTIISAFAKRGGIGHGIIATIMESFDLEIEFHQQIGTKVRQSWSLVDCGEGTMTTEQRLEFINRRIPEIYPDAYIQLGDGTKQKPVQYGHTGDKSIDWMVGVMISETKNISVMANGKIEMFPDENPDSISSKYMNIQTAFLWNQGQVSCGETGIRKRIFKLSTSKNKNARFLRECLPDIEKLAMNADPTGKISKDVPGVCKTTLPKSLTDSQISEFMKNGEYVVVERIPEGCIFITPSGPYQWGENPPGLPRELLMPESVEQCLADWDRYHRVANPKESKSDTKKVPISLITHTMNTSQEKFLGKLLTPEQNEEFDRIGRLLSSGIEGLALSEEFKTEFLRKAKNAFIGTGKKKVSLFDVIVKTFSQKEEDEKLTPADYSEFIEEVMSSHTPIDVIDATLAISTPVFAVYGAKVLEMVKTDIGAEEFDAAIASVVSKETLEDFKKEIIDGYGTAPGEKEREKVEALMNDGYGDEVAYAIYSVIIGSGSTKK